MLSRWSSLALVAVSVCACSGGLTPDDERELAGAGPEPTASIEQDIFGSAPSAAEWATGAVQLQTANGGRWDFCSGVLLSPGWVLTAGHCIAAGVAPGNVNVRWGSIWRHAQSISYRTDRDMALIRLDNPYALADLRAKGYPGSIGFYNKPKASLLNKTITVTGFAGSTGQDPTTISLQVVDVTADAMFIVTEAPGTRGTEGGDSGGPVFLRTRSGLALAGVHKGAGSVSDVPRHIHVTVDGVQEWTLRTIAEAEGSRMVCVGNNCLSNPSPLPNSLNTSATFNPCRNGCFNLTADYSFENNADFLKLSGYFGTITYTGNGPLSYPSFCPVYPMGVGATTNGSVQSSGLKLLSAACVDW